MLHGSAASYSSIRRLENRFLGFVKMSRMQVITIAFVLPVLCICGGGCGVKFLDPTQVGRFRPTPAVNVILDSLGVAEESPVAWEKTEEPRPGDIVAVPADYVFMSGDIVRVSIYELYQESVPAINDYVVTESGKISIPDIGVIQAAGLTETQLEEEIKRIVSPDILKEPSVSASLVNSQQRTFSILGEGVLAPNRYVIPRYDFRLADALASAGGVRQFNVSYIYVSRSIEEQEGIIEQAGNEKPKTKLPELQTIEPAAPKRGNFEQQLPELRNIEPNQVEHQQKMEQEMMEMMAPSAGHLQLNHGWPQSRRIDIGSTGLSGDRELAETALSRRSEIPAGNRWPAPANNFTGSSPVLGVQDMTSRPSSASSNESSVRRVFRDGKWVPIQISPAESIEPAIEGGKANERDDWIFKDGRWIPIPFDSQKPVEPAVKFEAEKPAGSISSRQGTLDQKLPEELQWEDAVQTRVIKVPVARLLAGDPRYNIVIKPGDTINVPVDIIGEFAIMGNVNLNGYINITGRPMTLKMAIAAAGGLAPLAWPKSCEVIRRIGDNKEEIVMVDLDKISSGEQPDFFIKPNDLINVGTHSTARWRAVLRNAFRATYGYGFVYDRNFADVDYGKDYPRPHWF
jgi:protein involved in polysaccharide export with SLBB domain